MSEPIMIPCEGSGCRGHRAGDLCAMCPMCGRFVAADIDAVVVAHERDDVLARIARGDFR